MKPRVTFQWINPCPNERLRVAQQMLLESIQALGLEPSLFPAGPEMIKFGDILRHARQQSVGTCFAWCHSDVLLTKDPFLLADRGKVVGFHRRELPSGEICPEVDMYLIPNLMPRGRDRRRLSTDRRERKCLQCDRVDSARTLRAIPCNAPSQRN